MSAFRQRLYLHGLNGVMRLAPALAGPVALPLARWLGRMGGRVHPQRAMAMENLRRAFGSELDEAGLHRLRAEFYEHASLTFFEILQMGRWSAEQVTAATEVEGLEHLEAARAGGQGVIVIGGHLGNWEIGGAGLAQRGFPLSVVSQPQRNATLQDYLAAARRRLGVAMIPRTSLRDCFGCLRANGLLVLMIDQRVREGGLLVPFFGQPASSAPGPAAIALKTGAPVVLIAARRVRTSEGAVRHRVEIQPPIALIRTGDRERDLFENTACFQLAVEEAIRRAPAQWLWTHRRWGLKVVRPRRERRGSAPDCRA
jgi:Kdo2-lipid IVA lauroyltransferase/acyltransferase